MCVIVCQLIFQSALLCEIKPSKSFSPCNKTSVDKTFFFVQFIHNVSSRKFRNIVAPNSSLHCAHHLCIILCAEWWRKKSETSSKVEWKINEKKLLSFTRRSRNSSAFLWTLYRADGLLKLSLQVHCTMLWRVRGAECDFQWEGLNERISLAKIAFSSARGHFSLRKLPIKQRINSHRRRRPFKELQGREHDKWELWTLKPNWGQSITLLPKLIDELLNVWLSHQLQFMSKRVFFSPTCESFSNINIFWRNATTEWWNECKNFTSA